MTIEILPARLANQIAAGEVVERPASVVKELVENSIDAGATSIKIDIEKGGAKRIRISDNGSGIVKDELMLALSRHATSKIKNLNDLEGICSLGFRGEALASISSVARLTLTSKPIEQESAWQAIAEGRDMAVSVQPAAHPNGTTIDVVDLFFNTPARRKFLRTEKTEFTHIEEVIKRIALAHFDVSFILSHNHKVIKQYKAVKDKKQCAKRVAQICGQRFIEHALEVDCQHDDLHLSGWVADPSFFRNQNDLCYSYVNGRMMRDKLINHAIRQAYSNLLPANTYPAFVLFLQLDVREVDVNVHPAKHEVRFHQGRYIHDFIYSVCHKAISAYESPELLTEDTFTPMDTEQQTSVLNQPSFAIAQSSPASHQNSQLSQISKSYIKPLTKVSDVSSGHYQLSQRSSPPVSTSAAQAYQNLMTPFAASEDDLVADEQALIMPQATVTGSLLLKVIANKYGVVNLNDELRLLSLAKLDQAIQFSIIEQRWQGDFISQPLLLPIKLTLDPAQIELIEQYRVMFEKLGIIVNTITKNAVQIRQFPALLRHRDVSASLVSLLDSLLSKLKCAGELTLADWQQSFANLLICETFTEISGQELLLRAKKCFNKSFDQQLELNSVVVDLTSTIMQLN